MDMDMSTDAMSKAMEMMDTAGRTMTTDWGTVSERLTGLAGQLGGGELGAAFLDRYGQAAAATAAAVGDHCRHPGLMAAAGHRCADLYATADQNVAGSLGPVAPAAPPADPGLG
jgi:hypothetical protein